MDDFNKLIDEVANDVEIQMLNEGKFDLDVHSIEYARRVVAEIQNRQKAIAWMANDCADGYILCHTERHAEKEARGIDARVIPLFRLPALCDDKVKEIDNIIDNIEVVINYAGDGMLVNWKNILINQCKKLKSISGK